MRILDKYLPMITTVTGKNQITIPAAIATRMGLKNGSRLDWRLTDKPDEIVCVLMPEFATLAANLRGAGRPHLKPGQDPVADLVAERTSEETDRCSALR
jgi:AbrB family looped-hinge helix DNA binding protein